MTDYQINGFLSLGLGVALGGAFVLYLTLGVVAPRKAKPVG